MRDLTLCETMMKITFHCHMMLVTCLSIYKAQPISLLLVPVEWHTLNDFSDTMNKWPMPLESI